MKTLKELLSALCLKRVPFLYWLSVSCWWMFVIFGAKIL